ncbi:MAG: hypothetical protein Q4D51_09020 [Eubacteriales bacterium]|nr:hypothetical protein [Eubacteriales bacterium]
MNNRKSNNQGNSYITVVATLSFLAVLVAAILVAVALCYRLRAYNLNSRDNFYYLEQAMDEIYAGVGADAMKHLNTAYDETIETIVYFDPVSKSYVTMENKQANELMGKYFVSLLKGDDNYKSNSEIKTHLNSFLTNRYDASDNPEGVQLDLLKEPEKDDDGIVIKNLVLRRQAKYSTMNAVKKDGKIAASEDFVQTISTDLAIRRPEFEVNFNTIGSDLNELYKFAMIADMGVEVNSATTKTTINGNIYAAADFYNKSYNGRTAKYTTLNAAGEEKEEEKEVNLHCYSGATLAKFDGVQESSMYSGFYINGSDVTITANKVIIPGTLAIMNSGSLNMGGLSQSVVSATNLWADNVTLGGYSLQDPNDKEKLVGSSVTMRANAYISDDLELNAAGSDFVLNGQYYGYNYASTDNRTYSVAALKKAANRTYSDAVASAIKNKVPDGNVGDDARVIRSQAHYNSSAIIVNGKDSTLDLSKTSAMYIAGQSYIEMSKATTKKEEDKDTGKKDSSGNAVTEKVETYTYNYLGMDDDNYSQDTVNTVKKSTKGAVQDYRTGEAISVKSSQLAYIPIDKIVDNGTEMYAIIPTELRDQELFKDIWENLEKVPVVKNVISGKPYYYYDFSQMVKEGADARKINDFIAEYSRLVNTKVIDENGKEMDYSEGDVLGLTDIGDYTYFKINSLRLHGDRRGSEEKNNEYSVYTNSAISFKEPAIAIDQESRVTIKAKSSNMKALLAAAENINSAENEKQGNTLSTDDNPNGVSTVGMESMTNSGDQLLKATEITTKLQSHYKEMRYLLTNTSHDLQGVNEAHSLLDNEISPLNHYFNMQILNNMNLKEYTMESGDHLWLSGKDESVVITSTEDKASGVIICKGDVTFADNIKEFQGLIVTGGKIKVNHSMNFTANEEIVKTVLRECDEAQGSSKEQAVLIKIFKQYVSLYQDKVPGTDIDVESTKSITAIQFEDILSFENWKKNVE